MDFELTEAQVAVRRSARTFAEAEVRPLARESDEKREFPWHLVPRMGQLGFLGGPLPPEYGGAGFDYVSMAFVYEEISKACSSVRGFLAVHVGLTSMCIYDWGTEEQKRAYLPRLASGQTIGCYCLTEPNAGTDVASMETTARREGNEYVINGRKHWITNGNRADLALVFASADRALKHKGICAFLVDTCTPGFKRQRMIGMELGHRASDHAVIDFEEMRVPRECLLGAEGDGFKVAMGALDHGRLGVAAGAVGVAQACVDPCVEFARTRRQSDKPIGDFPLIQERVRG
ncbi:MAG: acyl-CoA dehydrogenase family protein, partial [Actinobacteria bacterium]|nr:acyl-CoA dehydrogenase family protein [Actinomycetota bacterium]